MSNDISKLLTDPFEASDIEWRVQRSGPSSSGGWAIVVAYVTNRAVQQRLDDVFGVDGWENTFTATPDGKGYLCGIKALFGDKWVTKWDASEYTNVEPLKGAISGAMKRAAVQFGVGRYLYNLDEQWLKCSPVNSRYDVKHNYIKIKAKGGQGGFDCEWITPELPNWARPSAKAENYIAQMESAETLDELKAAFQNAYKYASSFNRKDLVKSFTDVKDQKKYSLDTQEMKSELEHYKKVEEWLQKSIKDLIHSAPNESVLVSSKNKLKRELEDKFHGQPESCSELTELLKHAFTAKSQTFKQGNQNV